MELDDLLWAMPQAWTDPEPELFNHALTIKSLLTTLLIQKYFGGSVMQATVNHRTHYFNQLQSGAWLDASRADLWSRTPYKDIRKKTKEHDYIGPGTWEKVLVLEDAVIQTLMKAGRYGGV